MREESGSEPAAMEDAFPALMDVKEFDGRLSFYLVHETVEALLVLDGDRAGNIVSGVEPETAEKIAIFSLKTYTPAKLLYVQELLLFRRQKAGYPGLRPLFRTGN